MSTLVIQTILPEVEILLLDAQNNLQAGKKWTSNKDEVAKLIPQIFELLKENSLQFKDLKKILVINGIGGFSSTRIGVTIANVMAMAIKAELYELTWPKETQQKPLIELVKDFWLSKPQPVQTAQPIYSSEPLISESKKKKFV